MKKAICGLSICCLLILLYSMGGRRYYGQSDMGLSADSGKITITDMNATADYMSFTILTDIDYSTDIEDGLWDVRCETFYSRILNAFYLDDTSSAQSYRCYERDGKLAADMEINSFGLSHKYIKITLLQQQDVKANQDSFLWKNSYFSKKKSKYFIADDGQRIKAVCSGNREISIKIESLKNMEEGEEEVFFRNGMVVTSESVYVDGSLGKRQKYRYSIVLKEDVDINDIVKIEIDKMTLEELR